MCKGVKANIETHQLKDTRHGVYVCCMQACTCVFACLVGLTDVGVCDGEDVGATDGLKVSPDCCVGLRVVGTEVGLAVVGLAVRLTVGLADGLVVGTFVGVVEGVAVLGTLVGASVLGAWLGETVDGLNVGDLSACVCVSV